MSQFKFITQLNQGKNQIQHYLITIALYVIGWQFLGIIPLYFYVINKTEDFNTLANSAKTGFRDLGIDQNLLLVLYGFMFLGGLIALLFGIKYIHKRNVLSVLTSRPSLDWHRIFTSFSAWFLLSLMVVVVQYYLQPQDYEWNFKPLSFAILCIVAVVFIPIQISMEEVFFRGYLLQGLGSRFKSVPLAILSSSILFGLLHGMNPEIDSLGWGVMVFYIGTGIFLAILTVMDEGLELSLGFHAANNMAAILLVTTDWTVVKTDALLLDTAEPSLGFDTFFPMLVLYPILFLFFYKKYRWSIL